MPKMHKFHRKYLLGKGEWPWIPWDPIGTGKFGAGEEGQKSLAKVGFSMHFWDPSKSKRKRKLYLCVVVAKKRENPNRQRDTLLFIVRWMVIGVLYWLMRWERRSISGRKSDQKICKGRWKQKLMKEIYWWRIDSRTFNPIKKQSLGFNSKFFAYWTNAMVSTVPLFGAKFPSYVQLQGNF